MWGTNTTTVDAFVKEFGAQTADALQNAGLLRK
jgi:hypothetical protein